MSLAAQNTQKLSTAEAIAEAGFRVLSRNPNANLAEIALAAGITRATLHRYFPSREKLIHDLAFKAIEEMDTAVAQACADSPTAAAALKDCMLALIPLGDRHGFLAHEQLEHDPKLQAAFDDMRAETLEWVEAAKVEGIFDASVPNEWISRSFDYLLYAAWDAVRAEEVTPKQATNLAWQTLTSGLGSKS